MKPNGVRRVVTRKRTSRIKSSGSCYGMRLARTRLDRPRITGALQLTSNGSGLAPALIA